MAPAKQQLKKVQARVDTGLEGLPRNSLTRIPRLKSKTPRANQRLLEPEYYEPRAPQDPRAEFAQEVINYTYQRQQEQLQRNSEVIK